MSRKKNLETTDLVAAAAGAVFGIGIGLILGGAVGRVNSRRIKAAIGRLSGQDGAPKHWTEDDAERLEARVLDALGQDVVLARRHIRVAVLGMGLVELTGTVLHNAEIGVASDIVERVEGVETVLNHLVVETPKRPLAPRAAGG